MKKLGIHITTRVKISANNDWKDYKTIHRYNNKINRDRIRTNKFSIGVFPTGRFFVQHNTVKNTGRDCANLKDNVFRRCIQSNSVFNI